LLILASGPPAAAAAVEPVFSAIGRKTVWLGEAGQGSRMKPAVSAYMAILIEGVAEALELAGQLGLDDTKLAEAIEGGPLEWALKDVDLALDAAGDGGLPLLAALSRQCAKLWTRATAGTMSVPHASRSAIISSLNCRPPGTG
jgi:3-hydroxyisobutyrate dehydrogenase